jgi:hypothetical protein
VLEKLNNLPSSLNAIRVIKGRTLRLTVRVKSINDHKVLVGKLEGRDFLEELALDGRIFKQILKKREWRAWISLIWLRVGTCGGLL